MRKFTNILAVGLALLFCQIAIQAQTTGTIAGTVTDPNGAVVPGASVTIKGEAGQDFSVVTNDGGSYRVPAVQNGIYVVTVTARGFKTLTVTKVKVDVGTPVTVDAKLEIGDVGEVVQIASGGEVLQTQTATVGSTIRGRQIVETPIASRDALDIVGLLPGTATVGRPRTATINGLPKGALTITIDGVDAQANDARSSDGYFTYVRPRVDAIEEVTVSTANPGAESSGDGAIQINFVTKRGTNDYNGGVFWQHRNDAFNANYWYLNRNPSAIDANGKSVRQKMRLNQYGVHFGGPIPFLGFGEGTPIFNSGKDKRFFFFNYEEFRNPASLSRTRNVLTPAAQGGDYKYQAAIPSGGLPTGCVNAATSGQMECTRNIFTIAAANGQLATVDPTIANVYNRIRTGLSGATFVAIPGNSNVVQWNTLATSQEVRKFLALRFDFNVTKNHAVEFVINRQDFDSFPDLLNGRESVFPGFPAYSQASKRNSYSMALRSTLSKSIVNELRYAIQEGGPTLFFGEIKPADFDYLGGRSITIGVTLGGNTSTSPVTTNSDTVSKNPAYDLTDSVTWVKGSHSFNFGGQFKRIIAEGNSLGRAVPSVTFGLNSSTGSPDLPAFNMFCATVAAACPNPTLPGATSGQLSEIRQFYATFVGRVSGYTSTAFLNTDTGVYAENARAHRLAEQRSYGLFIQDSWRMRPNFTVNYGVRWQPQTGYVAKTFGNYTRLESYDQVYGLSGLGNIFKPGTLTGTAPRVVPIAIGESTYPTDWNNFAPTVGVVWSPNFGEKGFMRFLFGRSGQSVFRGGYSVSFVREGTDLLGSINGANPGGSRSLSRSSSLAGSVTLGTNYRDPNNPNLTPLPGIVGTSPAFPIALGVNDSTNAFNPNIKTGKVASYSFGYQRELDRNTVIEVRYVGNKGTGMQRQYNLNEFNTVENGFAAEFALAQANLYANIQNGFASSGFAYRGANTGTSPLPIMLSYFTNFGSAAALATASLVAGNYTATNFNNSTLVTALSRNNPTIGTFSGASFENDATRRLNALANGRPINFFYVNPTTPTGGSWTVDNTNETWYNSGVIEVRRRMSNGLRLSANYVFSKAMANAFTADAGGGGGLPPTLRPGGFELARNVQISDIRHQFKVDSTYDLPFGRGRQFLSGVHGILNGFVSGWSIAPTLRWQSGSPISLGNVQLVGMTAKELQKAIKIRKEASLVFWLPDDIILNTQKAFNISVANTLTNSGYGTTFGTGGPTGRFIAPAGYGNCVATYGGQCGVNRLVVYGPHFFKLDASLSKKTRIGERLNFELRATFLDALNHPNFRVTSWTGDTAAPAIGGNTFGQLGNGAAYQDTSTTNDPGGRVIDLMLRINW